MAKTWGILGFVPPSTETVPGVWSSTPVELPFTGDILKNGVKWENDATINSDISLNNHLSIVADDGILKDLAILKYVKLKDYKAKWKVTSFTLDYPRLTINLGGVYNQ